LKIRGSAEAELENPARRSNAGSFALALPYLGKEAIDAEAKKIAG
jgi:hypothetical protein